MNKEVIKNKILTFLKNLVIFIKWLIKAIGKLILKILIYALIFYLMFKFFWWLLFSTEIGKVLIAIFVIATIINMPYYDSYYRRR